jgi:hypothetical protein
MRLLLLLRRLPLLLLRLLLLLLLLQRLLLLLLLLRLLRQLRFPLCSLPPLQLCFSLLLQVWRRGRTQHGNGGMVRTLVQQQFTFVHTHTKELRHPRFLRPRLCVRRETKAPPPLPPLRLPRRLLSQLRLLLLLL